MQSPHAAPSGGGWGEGARAWNGSCSSGGTSTRERRAGRGAQRGRTGLSIAEPLKNERRGISGALGGCGTWKGLLGVGHLSSSGSTAGSASGCGLDPDAAGTEGGCSSGGISTPCGSVVVMDSEWAPALRRRRSEWHFIASSSDTALPVRRHWLVGQDRARGDEPPTGRLEVRPAPPCDRHMASGDPGLERVLASGDDGVATGEFGRIESMIATPPAGRGGARFGVLIPALKRACPLPDRTNDARATPERALGEKYL